MDPSTVTFHLPQGAGANPVGIMARLENINVDPDVSAKVIVDERTGTVVMGEAVRISTVAVASGSLSISITEGEDVSQALPFAPACGRTVATPHHRSPGGRAKEQAGRSEKAEPPSATWSKP